MSSTQNVFPRIHLIGIGGCGMNGVAQLAAHAGYEVSGSDRASKLEVFQTLEELGIRIVAQDGSGITPETDFVVYSTAIESKNPDLQKARALGIPQLHRAEMLARLCRGRELIAVAGTAGKSTVTGLLGWIFECLGKHPTVYCGASINNFGASVRAGAPGGPWILEVDESDRSFLHFQPTHAIVTNIAEDHFSLAELHRLFAQFEERVTGTLIKQPHAFHCDSQLIGRHNVENVNHALTLCSALGLDLETCRHAVQSFRGIERRLQRHGDQVIDDFAHSPIKIAAAMRAARDELGTFQAVWRPHGFAPLLHGKDGLIEAFAAGRARRVFILPVYYAGGTVERKISAPEFVDGLCTAGVVAEFAPDYSTLERRLLEEGDPVLLMGARDPQLPRFARQLAAKK